MRKLIRSVIRHRAEKENYKTRKAFRYLCKNYRTRQGETFVHGKPVKQKSMLHRAISSIFKK